jgi:hypothetical protein
MDVNDKKDLPSSSSWYEGVFNLFRIYFSTDIGRYLFTIRIDPGVIPSEYLAVLFTRLQM